MRDIRIGNDFTIKWSLYKNDGETRTPYEVTGAAVLKLCSAYGTREVYGWQASGNTIVWTFRGADQRHLGPYQLVYIENEGTPNMMTVDTCDAFCLVSQSCQQSDPSELLMLESDIVFAEVRMIDDELSATSPNAISNSAVTEALGKKVDAVPGKGLSTEDFTTADKAKLQSLENYNDAEIREALNEKQDAIPDLETIRQGAQKGATALQEHQDISHLATKQEVEDIFPMKMVTYADLVAMRNEGRLVPGQQYRIIDFVTTVDQADVKSAGHQFDVIVTADGPSVLNEKARAAISEGDTYFTEAGANLKAWQLWYCLDNDKSRFEWADDKIRARIYFSWEDYTGELIVEPYPEDETIEGMKVLYVHNKEDGSQLYIVEGGSVFDEALTVIGTCLTISSGKGVIYRMIDEWQNDVPYDFKNVVYTPVSTFECMLYGVTHTYTRNGNIVSINGADYYGFTRTRTGSGPPPPPENLYVTVETLSTSMSLYTISGEVASIYTSATVQSVVNAKTGYTFHAINADASIDPNSKCYNNVIKPYVINGFLRLNNITFRENSATDAIFYNNTFGQDCHDNLLDGGCYNNTFGVGCYGNILRSGCYGNILRSNCWNNAFQTSCYNNTFGVGCSTNIFGSNCENNTFGSMCIGNTLGRGCSENIFTAKSIYNVFGDYCKHNNLDVSGHNTFGRSCRYNALHSNCHYNTFGDFCECNILGNNCYYCELLGEYYEAITFNSNVSYLKLSSKGGSETNKAKGYRVCSEIHGTSASPLTIDVERNRDYETTIAMNSAGEVKVFCMADLIE